MKFKLLSKQIHKVNNTITKYHRNQFQVEENSQSQQHHNKISPKSIPGAGKFPKSVTR